MLSAFEGASGAPRRNYRSALAEACKKPMKECGLAYPMAR